MKKIKKNKKIDLNSVAGGLFSIEKEPTGSCCGVPTYVDAACGCVEELEHKLGKGKDLNFDKYKNVKKTNIIF